MFKNFFRTLKDRPIVSIIICVVIAELFQVLFSTLFDVPQSVYYCITVIAMLALFVTPVVLYFINQKKKDK